MRLETGTNTPGTKIPGNESVELNSRLEKEKAPDGYPGLFVITTNRDSGQENHEQPIDCPQL
jgi:hypothetical protein